MAHDRRTVGKAKWPYGAAAGIAASAGLALVWMNAAAGIIGPEEDDPANLLFGAVIAAAAGGAVLARGRPAGMARAMLASAAAQAAVTGIALAGGLGAGEPVWPWAFTALMAIFIMLWLSAAWLFGTAARAE